MKITKRIIALMLVIASLVLCLAGCRKKNPENPYGTVYSLDQYTEDTSTEAKDYYYVAMSVQGHGVIILELDATNAPITVQNFVKLVREDFYNGLTFHRVIEGFMIQGGDPNADGSGGSGTQIFGEFSANGYNNPIAHKKGVISMARRGNNYDSATSQFFICNATNSDVSGLDGQYAAFGHVIQGIEVVDSITASTDKYGDYNGTIQNKSNQAVITEMKVILYTEA